MGARTATESKAAEIGSKPSSKGVENCSINKVKGTLKTAPQTRKKSISLKLGL